MRPVDGPELTAAIDWWANAIQGQVMHNLGRVESDAMADWAMRLVRPATPEQIETFKTALRAAVLADEAWARTWSEAEERGEPSWGSAFRILATDYGPQLHLANAVEAAGFSKLLPPMMTAMWVNPGWVRAGVGHAAPIETIYEEERHDA